MRRATVIATVLWAVFGLKLVAASVLHRDSAPLPLRISLTKLPMEVFGHEWRGENIPLESDVEEAARVTAYLQRNYRKEDRTLWLYVGYVGTYAPGSIHYPEICYPGSGFELTSKQVVTIPAPEIPTELRFCEFLWKNPRGGGTYTLSSFYYNGKLQPEDWRIRWDSLFGIRYFVIITLSGSQLSTPEETREEYQAAARRMLPTLLEHFEK